MDSAAALARATAPDCQRSKRTWGCTSCNAAAPVQVASLLLSPLTHAQLHESTTTITLHSLVLQPYQRSRLRTNTMSSTAAPPSRSSGSGSSSAVGAPASVLHLAWASYKQQLFKRPLRTKVWCASPHRRRTAHAGFVPHVGCARTLPWPTLPLFACASPLLSRARTHPAGDHISVCCLPQRHHCTAADWRQLQPTAHAQDGGES